MSKVRLKRSGETNHWNLLLLLFLLNIQENLYECCGANLNTYFVSKIDWSADRLDGVLNFLDSLIASYHPHSYGSHGWPEGNIEP